MIGAMITMYAAVANRTGGIGAMITMYAAVANRTGGIGTLRAAHMQIVDALWTG